MRDRKLIVLVILGVLAVGSLIYGILTPSLARRQLSTSAASPAAGPASIAAGLPVERHSARSLRQGWGRSPFTLQPGKGVGLVLNGIAWDETLPKAIINDEIVGKGDRIGGKIVVKITPTTVIISDGTRETELRPGQSR